MWYMQAYLRDLSQQRPDSASFLICQRILHECHEIIFGDLPSAPYSSLRPSALLSLSRKKVRSHLQPALVGIGMVWAGVPGMPSLTHIMGPVAIEQGRVDEQGQDIRSIERYGEEGAMVRSASMSSAVDNSGEDDDSVGEGESPPSERLEHSDPSHPSSTVTDRMPRRQTIAAQTSPALPLHLRDLRKPRMSADPFGQEDTPPERSAAGPSPFQSTPSFASRHPYRPNSLLAADLLLQKYDFASQMHLLRGHYCRSEVRSLYASPKSCVRHTNRSNSFSHSRTFATSC